MYLKGENITFGYKKNNLILKDVNISLGSGEILGLVGDSGSGKSTLCKILAGYETRYKGKVSLDGKPLPSKGYNPVQLIFQHPEKAVNPKWRMEDILNELSGGELQRFALARALSPKTRFLIADEITTMVDAITQAQIWNVLLSIVEELNIGVLVVSHDRNLINRLCHDTIYLRDISSA